MEGPDEARSQRLEDLWEMIHHGRRINAGLALVAEQLEGELAYIETNEDCKRLVRAWQDQAPAKTISSITADRANQMGGQLRRTYCVACHFFQWQGTALGTLMSLYQVVQDGDITWNYSVVWPLMQLFTLYCKVHIQVATMPSLVQAVRVYLGCLRRVDINDPTSRLLDGMIERCVRSVEKLRVEVQMFLSDVEFRKGFFYGIVQPLSRVLDGYFDWDRLAGSDDRFFDPWMLSMSHITAFCEAYTCYGLTHLEAIGADPQQWGLFQRVIENLGTFQMFGARKLEFPALMQLFAKGKPDSVGGGRYSPQRTMVALAKRIRHFSHAAEIDLGVLCRQGFMLFGLMGTASFHLENVLRRGLTDISAEIVHLLYWQTRLATQMMNIIPEIKRFVVYNLHEFDAPYIESFSRSFSMPQIAFDQLQWLAAALRGVDIGRYDQGESLDLYPAISYADSIALRLNKNSVRSGCAHLRPLLELLAGVAWRMRLYQDTFDTIMRFARLNQLWPYMSAIADVTGDCVGASFEENVIALQLCHYYPVDDITVAETRGLSRRVGEHFELLRKRITQVINTRIGDCAKGDAAKDMAPLTKSLAVLRTLREMGVVQVAGEERDPFGEVWNALLEHILRQLQRDAEQVPPAGLVSLLDRTRGVLQLVGAAGAVSFPATMDRMLSEFSPSGSSGQMFVKRYTGFARGVMKSGVPFSVTRLSFLGDELAPWTSLAALNDAARVFQPVLFQEIVRELAEVVVQHAGVVVDGILGIGKGLKDINDPPPQCTEKAVAENVGKLGHLAAVIQLRQLLLPYAGSGDVGNIAERLKTVQSVGALRGQGDRFAAILAWMMTSPYWDGFSWDRENECAKDNPHLWSLFFDAAFDQATGGEFYRSFFARAHFLIRRAAATPKKEKGSSYPGLQLLIVVEQMARRTSIGSFGDFERLVCSPLMRIVYANPNAI